MADTSTSVGVAHVCTFVTRGTSLQQREHDSGDWCLQKVPRSALPEELCVGLFLALW